MRGRKPSRYVLIALSAVLVTTTVAGQARAVEMPQEDQASKTIVTRWNTVALETVRRSTMGPPMIARALAILHTCIYDAWAAYDGKAVGTQLGGELRQPLPERTARNINAAIAYAGHRAATDLWPESKALFDEFMTDQGYPPDQRTTTAGGIGVAACEAVLDYRHHDGSNQLGDLHDGPYSDYTGYQPANAPMVVGKPLDRSTVRDPSRWQPLSYPGRDGKQLTQRFLAPHWGYVRPFAMTSWDQFGYSSPAAYGSAAFVQQAQELVDLNAGLGDREKVIAEYWADGPRSEQPPGHWTLFAEYVSQRDQHSVRQDVLLFFALSNALLDASIVCWGTKRKADSVRPITAIRYLFQGKQIAAWPKAGRSSAAIDGARWLPYQPSYFPTPPFGEYVSGHSSFSAASAEVLKLFTGSDSFRAVVTIPAGSSRVEPGVSPRTDVVLEWPTFSGAADEAGISRRYGGIHFKDADLAGRAIGRLVGRSAWDKAGEYVAGTATS